jgi:hypothetical protein
MDGQEFPSVLTDERPPHDFPKWQREYDLFWHWRLHGSRASRTSVAPLSANNPMLT